MLDAHDWHASLATVYLAAAGRPGPSVLTIHNLAFQGLLPPGAFADLGLPAPWFGLDGLEFWGRVSFMKGGLLSADRITTVRPTYASAILTAEKVMGLDGVLLARAPVVGGIPTGVDSGV